MNFFLEHKYALLFYALVILLVYLNRRKFEIRAKIIALYKTKIGLKLMDTWAEKYREFFKIFGYCGIGIGFAAMIFIVVMLLINLFSLMVKPEAISGVSPVIPGIKIPGSTLFVPLIMGWIVLFIIIVVHEFSHGVVARAHNIKIKSSGILFFGPIMGAFVEPDEKEFEKRDPVVKYSVFAAGSFSNIILAFVVFILLLGVVPLKGSFTQSIGFSVGGVMKDFPAEKAGIKAGDIIIGVNGKEIKTHEEFQREYQYTRPGEEVRIKTNSQEYVIKTVEQDGRTMIGIKDLKDERKLKNDSLIYKFGFGISSLIEEFLKWIYILSLGIGIINLLPLGPIDGGRIMHTALQQMVTDKKRAFALFSRITSICIIILLLNIFYPGIRYLAGRIF